MTIRVLRKTFVVFLNNFNNHTTSVCSPLVYLFECHSLFCQRYLLVKRNLSQILLFYNFLWKPGILGAICKFFGYFSIISSFIFFKKPHTYIREILQNPFTSEIKRKWNLSYTNKTRVQKQLFCLRSNINTVYKITITSLLQKCYMPLWTPTAIILKCDKPVSRTRHEAILYILH
jgi:hypothetical protein